MSRKRNKYNSNPLVPRSFHSQLNLSAALTLRSATSCYNSLNVPHVFHFSLPCNPTPHLLPTMPRPSLSSLTSAQPTPFLILPRKPTLFSSSLLELPPILPFLFNFFFIVFSFLFSWLPLSFFFSFPFYADISSPFLFLACLAWWWAGQLDLTIVSTDATLFVIVVVQEGLWPAVECGYL